jgi:hypothetical protein
MRLASRDLQAQHKSITGVASLGAGAGGLGKPSCWAGGWRLFLLSQGQVLGEDVREEQL